MPKAHMIINEEKSVIKFVDETTNEEMQLSSVDRLSCLQSGYKALELQLKELEKSGQKARVKKLRDLFLTEINTLKTKSNQSVYEVPVLFRRHHEFSNREIVEVLRNHVFGH